MRKLLLISSSRSHGTHFLEHCLSAVEKHLAGKKRLLFVPFALKDHRGYANVVQKAVAPLGLTVDSLHEFDDKRAKVDEASCLFIGGGNSFRLLKALYDFELIDPIRRRVLEDGMPYMGSSAGTNMACPTIRTTNDMPIVQPPSFDALNLIPYQINPHYLDPAPGSTHMGETREQRIREFHEENELPVLGIREGSWLEISGDESLLCGLLPARLFRAGQDARELAVGTRLEKE